MFSQSPLNFLWAVLFSLEPGRIYSIQIPLMKKWWQWSQVLEAYNRARILDTTGSRKEAKFTYPSVRLAAELIQYCVLEREMLPLMMTGSPISCWKPWNCREDPRLEGLWVSEREWCSQGVLPVFIYQISFSLGIRLSTLPHFKNISRATWTQISYLDQFLIAPQKFQL